MYKTKSHYTMLRNPNGVWYYYAYDEAGRRLKRSTGKRNRRAAEAEVRERIADGTLLQMHDVHELRHMTFAEFAEPFWRWESCPIIRDKLARGGHYSPDLCAANRGTMEKHIFPAFAKRPLTAITAREIDSWLLSLPEKGNISPSTANKVLGILKQMLKVAVFEGYLEKSPAENVRPLTPNEKERGAFTKEDVSRMFSAKWPSRMSYTACFLSAFTGMRLGEVRALRCSRVHEDYILVDASWSDKAGLKCTKSGKARVVPITRRIGNMLSDLIAGRSGDMLVFSREGDAPYGDRAITDDLKEVMARCHIDYEGRYLTFHSFRHFWLLGIY